MIKANKQLVALALGLSVAIVASQASAQNMSKRDAAITQCIQEAHTQYPMDYVGVGASRTSVYKACMYKMHQRP
jgi:hypothetical protein